MKPNKQTTIQTLLALGKSQREIARATGIDRKTIRGYARRTAPANSPGVVTRSAEQIPPARPPAHTSACDSLEAPAVACVWPIAFSTVPLRFRSLTRAGSATTSSGPAWPHRPG